MVDKINSPIVVFRGCALPELFAVAKIVLLVLLVVLNLLAIAIFGLNIDSLLYGVCGTIFMELPVCWLLWGVIGKLKLGKPDCYYQQLLNYKIDQFLVNIGIKQPELYIPTGTWSVLRGIS